MPNPDDNPTTAPREPRWLRAADYPEAPPPDVRFSVKFLRQCRALPVAVEDGVLNVVMADPRDRDTLDALALATGLPTEPWAGDEQEIIAAVDRWYGEGATTIQKIVEDMDEGEEPTGGGGDADVDHLRDMASEAPVIRMVNLVIQRAAELGASDIHFEPFESRLVVRYRVDGILHEVESPPKRLQPAIISRVKIMARMNIAERRLPQDGRIKHRVRDHEVDIRVSTVPTVHGESLVLRLLDRSSVILSLEDLGFEPGNLETFAGLIAKPYGMILVTGPTGSGKTTTLYAALQKINSSEKKIITIEDPVEYQLEGVNQIQVKPKIGLDFASGLRSIVRQDPDIILVGEIRDRETAEIAVQSALTGHLVFSTVHTNDAAGAVTRLRDMGVESYLLASSVIGIMAQRLIRRVCPECREPDPAQRELLRQMGVKVGRDAVFHRGAGCAACSGTGFRGRLAIAELLPVDEEMRRLIVTDPGASEIRAAAVKRGMATLRDDGIRKVQRGVTTVAEVVRVTSEE